MNSRKPKTLGSFWKVLLGASLVGAVAILAIQYSAGKNEFKAKLPASASEVQEQFIDMFQDYSYLLKAKIPQNEFARYIKSLNLIRHSATRHYEDSQWETFLYWSEPTAKISWWDPTDQLDATYTRNSGETWVMAKHERGYLFLKNFHH